MIRTSWLVTGGTGVLGFAIVRLLVLRDRHTGLPGNRRATELSSALAGFWRIAPAPALARTTASAYAVSRAVGMFVTSRSRMAAAARAQICRLPESGRCISPGDEPLFEARARERPTREASLRHGVGFAYPANSSSGERR
jgi:hypothetical protein